MTIKNGDMPARPCKYFHGKVEDTEQYGVTKREYFAGLAMQGLLAGPHAEADCGIEGLAHDAVLAADKLLAELEKEES